MTITATGLLASPVGVGEPPTGCEEQLSALALNDIALGALGDDSLQRKGGTPGGCLTRHPALSTRSLR